MHVCEEFRERITERLLDHSERDTNKDIDRELLVCNSCADFYAESREMIEAFASVHFEVSDAQLDLMTDRLRVKIHDDLVQRQQRSWRTWFMPFAPAFVGALAILLVMVGLYRFNNSSRAVVPVAHSVANPIGLAPATNVDPSIDPVTMEFIEQSELLLRSVMKLKPTSVDDLKEAREIADRHLVALDQRKQAASGIQPVVEAMDRYETVLRDIHNVQQRSIVDDLADIKKRIEKNGLIADMKAFQPKVTTVDADVDHEQ